MRVKGAERERERENTAGAEGENSVHSLDISIRYNSPEECYVDILIGLCIERDECERV